MLKVGKLGKAPTSKIIHAQNVRCPKNARHHLEMPGNDRHDMIGAHK